MSNPSGDPISRLRAAVAAEEQAKAAWLTLENQRTEITRQAKAAYDLAMAATRTRMRLFAVAAAARNTSIRKLAEVTQPVENPDDLNRKNRERARHQAAELLRIEGEPLLAVELAERIGCPARAIRNYLDGDARFVIDHVGVGKRDAVRVSLA